VPVNVFISFSGEASEAVAEALHDWIPSVIQSVEPFLSGKNIESGRRWSPEIALKLEESGLGVLCLTPDNLDASWILFEAGALSKIVDESRVIPYLLEVERVQIRQPLAQFQSELAEKESTWRLLNSINNASEVPIKEDRLRATFEMWWPRLEEKLESAKARIRPSNKTAAQKSARDDNAINKSIGELIAVVQGVQAQLSRPERLIPPEYFMHLYAGPQSLSAQDKDNLQEALYRIMKASDRAKEVRALFGPDEIPSGIDRALRSLQTNISFARDRIRRILRGMPPRQSALFQSERAEEESQENPET